MLAAREHGNVHRAQELRAATIVKLLERSDAFRKPDRFAALLDACECDAVGRAGFENRPYPQKPLLLQALAAARSVNAGAIAARVVADMAARAVNKGEANPSERQADKIAEAIHAARVQAVEHGTKKTDPLH